jgi:hypothetical protein
VLALVSSAAMNMFLQHTDFKSGIIWNVLLGHLVIVMV